MNRGNNAYHIQPGERIAQISIYASGAGEF